MKKLIEDEYRETLRQMRRRRELPPADYVNGVDRRDLRRRRELQVVPPEYLHEVVHDQARPGVRVARCTTPSRT